MKVLRTHAEMRAYRASLPSSATVGFVPTMGGLHAGHASLIARSRKECDISVVSIFVNPAQFAAGEDLSTYPRTEVADMEICAQHETDVVYMPEVGEVYADGFDTYVETGCGKAGRNARSEGASRPTFFRGVATVMTKLLILIRPERTYFGQKDGQQCAVVKALVRDLGMEVEVVVGETVREADGLAMSTRNVYLSAGERAVAGSVWRALRMGRTAWEGGERETEVVRETVRTGLEAMRVEGVRVEVLYVSVCERDSLREVEGRLEGGSGRYMVCVAAMLGKARLIDNVVLT